MQKYVEKVKFILSTITIRFKILIHFISFYRLKALLILLFINLFSSKVKQLNWPFALVNRKVNLKEDVSFQVACWCISNPVMVSQKRTSTPRFTLEPRDKCSHYIYTCNVVLLDRYSLCSLWCLENLWKIKTISVFD